MKNPFRTRYRIVEFTRHSQPFQPQIWRWYWPFWSPLNMVTYTGYDSTGAYYRTMAEARLEIEKHRGPKMYNVPNVHEVP